MEGGWGICRFSTVGEFGNAHVHGHVLPPICGVQGTDSALPMNGGVKKLNSSPLVSGVSPPRGDASDREIADAPPRGQGSFEPFWLQASPAPGVSSGGVAILDGNFCPGTRANLSRRLGIQICCSEAIFGHQGANFRNRLGAGLFLGVFNLPVKGFFLRKQFLE